MLAMSLMRSAAAVNGSTSNASNMSFFITLLPNFRISLLERQYRQEQAPQHIHNRGAIEDTAPALVFEVRISHLRRLYGIPRRNGGRIHHAGETDVFAAAVDRHLFLAAHQQIPVVEHLDRRHREGSHEVHRTGAG